MIRLLTALSLLTLSCLLPSGALAVPFSFGASINSVGFQTSEGHVRSSFNIPFLGVLPQDRPLVLTLPDPLSFVPVVFFGDTSRGRLSLLLQDGATGGVLGGYQFFKIGGENSNAQYVVCDRPNHCESRFGNSGTNPPNSGGSGLFAWPGPPCEFGPLGCDTLIPGVPSCPFGPPFCVTQEVLEPSRLVIPNVGNGNLMATLDLLAGADCPFNLCTVEAAVSFTLDGLALEPVPEPTTLALWGMTAAGFGFITRRRRNRQATDLGADAWRQVRMHR